MAKLFGEYLVQKSLITEEQLLDALIAQIEEQNSVVKIVRDLNLMNTNEVLQVLKAQVVSQRSFLDSAKDLGFWNQGKVEKIFNYMSAQRTPLGEILLKKKILDIGKLTSALDEYFGEKIKNAPTEKIVSQNVAELDKMEDSYNEFFEFIKPKYFEILKSIADGLTVEKKINLNIWHELCDETHRIQGAANLYDLTEMAEFFEKSERTFRVILIGKFSDLKEDIIRKISFVLEDLETLLKSALIQHQKQMFKADFFSIEASANLIQSIYANLILIEEGVRRLAEKKGA